MAAAGDTKAKRQKTSRSTDLLHFSSANDNLKFLVKKKSQENGPPRTFRMQTPSVLSHVKEFLPQMEQANKKLEEKMKFTKSSELDIEAINSNEPYIEMNLAVYERDSDNSSSNSDENESDFESSESEAESTNEIRTEYVGRHEVTEENFVISKSKRCKVPVIEELGTTRNNNRTDSNGHKSKTCASMKMQEN